MQVGVGVPERDGLAAADPHGALRVAVVEAAGEGDDADACGHSLSAQPWIVKFSMTGLASSVSATCCNVSYGDVVGELELEVLALPHVLDAGDAHAA